MLTTVLVGTLAACSVPVFRYALEKWPADPYEVVIFHKGALPADQQAIVDRLSDDKNPAARKFANVRVRAVNLDAAPPAELAALWKEQKDAAPPWMVLRYPPTHPIPSPWSGPFSSENVELLLDSQVRKELSQRILRGQTGVWLFLECGNKERDEAAYEILKAGVAKAHQTLKLPEIKAEDVREGLVSIDPAELRLEFSTVRVARSDRAEKFLVEMLLGSEEDLRETNEPMAFPTFGRGRVLYALVGPGINVETVTEACKTLVGECTCQIKEQNPGIDLVMSVDWGNLVQPKFDEKPLPPLVGVANFLGDGKNQFQPPQAGPEHPVTAFAPDDGSGATEVRMPPDSIVGTETATSGPRDPFESPAATAAAPATVPDRSTSERAPSALLRNSALAAGLVVIAVLVASLFLLRSKG